MDRRQALKARLMPRHYLDSRYRRRAPPHRSRMASFFQRPGKLLGADSQGAVSSARMAGVSQQRQPGHLRQARARRRVRLHEPLRRAEPRGISALGIRDARPAPPGAGGFLRLQERRAGADAQRHRGHEHHRQRAGPAKRRRNPLPPITSIPAAFPAGCSGRPGTACRCARSNCPFRRKTRSSSPTSSLRRLGRGRAW